MKLEKNEFVALKAPLSINLEVTERCNLSCGFCFNATPAYAQMMAKMIANEKNAVAIEGKILERKARLEKIIDNLAASEVFEVRLFGGEFTVFKYWREIMRYAFQKGLFISFVTNGYLLTKEDIELFAECRITECCISIHGTEKVHDDVVQKPGSFSRAMNSIRMLTEKGIKVGVAYTPHAKNLAHVKEFVTDLFLNHGVKGFGINRLFRDDRYENLTLQDYLNLLEVIDECQRLYPTIAITLGDSFPRCQVPMKHWKYLSYCSQGVGFAQIDFNGNIKHCSAISNTLGNVVNESLPNLWRKRLASFRSLDHLPLSCKICPIFCGGGCTASRGVEQKFAPDEFIPWPKDESLFRSYAKAIYNRVRKIFFDLFYMPPIASGDGQISLTGNPKVIRPFRLRQENRDTFIVMFAGSGTKILTPSAAEVLKLSDGTRSIEDMVRECNSKGLNLDALAVIEILKEFN